MENHVPITADLGYLYLLFEWVLIFKKSVASVSMGTYICGVLVFDGYLYSREYGIHGHVLAATNLLTKNRILSDLFKYR